MTESADDPLVTVRGPSWLKQVGQWIATPQGALTLIAVALVAFQIQERRWQRTDLTVVLKELTISVTKLADLQSAQIKLLDVHNATDAANWAESLRIGKKTCVGVWDKLDALQQLKCLDSDAALPEQTRKRVGR